MGAGNSIGSARHAVPVREPWVKERTQVRARREVLRHVNEYPLLRRATRTDSRRRLTKRRGFALRNEPTNGMSRRATRTLSRHRIARRRGFALRNEPNDERREAVYVSRFRGVSPSVRNEPCQATLKLTPWDVY